MIQPHDRYGPRPRISWNTNAVLMRTLWDGPHTMAELVEETGLSQSTIRGYIKAMRKQKLVAIVDLLMSGNGNRCIHVYQWRPDTKDYRVPKMTQAQRQARYRERRAKAEQHATLCFLKVAAITEQTAAAIDELRDRVT